MATVGDSTYLQAQLAAGHVGDDVLEVGSRDWQDGEGNMRSLVAATGRRWEGCDIVDGPGVDFTVDLLDDVAVAAIDRRWSTILVFNLLEHVYDPIHALQNIVSLLADGGRAIVCGPAVWELHAFPADYWRPQPDFFDEFAKRNEMEVADLTWVVQEWAYLPDRNPKVQLLPVDSLRDSRGRQVPGRHTAAQTFGAVRSGLSIGLQRVLNLTGRTLQFPKSSIGAVLVKL